MTLFQVEQINCIWVNKLFCYCMWNNEDKKGKRLISKKLVVDVSVGTFHKSLIITLKKAKTPQCVTVSGRLFRRAYNIRINEFRNVTRMFGENCFMSRHSFYNFHKFPVLKNSFVSYYKNISAWHELINCSPFKGETFSSDFT